MDIMLITQFEEYRSPKSRHSIFDNIPMAQFGTFRAWRRMMKRAGLMEGVARLHYRFRGPRIMTDHRHTLKQDAHAFSVYLVKEQYHDY